MQIKNLVDVTKLDFSDLADESTRILLTFIHRFFTDRDVEWFRYETYERVSFQGLNLKTHYKLRISLEYPCQRQGKTYRSYWEPFDIHSHFHFHSLSVSDPRFRHGKRQLIKRLDAHPRDEFEYTVFRLLYDHVATRARDVPKERTGEYHLDTIKLALAAFNR